MWELWVTPLKSGKSQRRRRWTRSMDLGQILEDLFECKSNSNNYRDLAVRWNNEEEEVVMCPLGLPNCNMIIDGIDLHYKDRSEVPQSCEICRDPMDHYGHAHDEATGDGLTRATVARLPMIRELLQELLTHDKQHWGMWTMGMRRRVEAAIAGLPEVPQAVGLPATIPADATDTTATDTTT